MERAEQARRYGQGPQQDGRGVGQEEWEVALLWPTVEEEIAGRSGVRLQRASDTRQRRLNHSIRREGATQGFRAGLRCD